MYSIEPSGGISSQVTSVCQPLPAVAVLHGVNVQPAEAPGERLVLLPLQVLVAEHQHLPVEPGAIDFAELLVGQRLRQVDAGHLGANVRGQGRDVDGVVFAPG
jgi:hypothetical protein